MHHVSALRENQALAEQHAEWRKSRERMKAAAVRRAAIEAEQRKKDELRRLLTLVPNLPLVVTQPKGKRLYESPIGPMRCIFLAPIEEIGNSVTWTVGMLGAQVPEDAEIPWKVLVQYICRKHRRTWVEISSARRTCELVSARHELWYLARRHTRLSLPQIGRATGGRDHTSILSGIRKYQRMLDAGLVTLWGDMCRPRKQVEAEVGDA